MFAGGADVGVFVPGTYTVKAVDGVGAGAEAAAAASMRGCYPGVRWLLPPYERPWLWRPLLEGPLLPRWWRKWLLERLLLRSWRL